MEVTINGIRAELGDSYPSITRKSIDINDPSVRFIDFTNKFNLPDTVTNRKIFDSPAGVGTNNRSFDKLYDVVISDVFNIFKGKGYLDGATRDKFSLQTVDESKELFKLLDTQLRSISWDDCDTELTTTAIDLLDAADIDSCWFWGKACYHESALQINTDQTTGDDRCKYSRPAFYVQGLFKRAIEAGGYNYIPSESVDLAISSCHKDFFFTSYQKTITASYSSAGTLALTGLSTNDFDHSSLTVTSTTINIGTVKTKFRLRGTVVTDAVISIVIKGIDNVDPTKIIESKITLPQDGVIDFTSSDFQSDNGMTIDIYFSGTGAISFTSVLLYTLISDKDMDLSTNPFLNYWIKVYDNLPELTYLDLYRLICVTSNQTHDVDNYNKNFGFLSLANLNKMNSVDWSDKFIIGSETLTAAFSGLFQKNWLKYENDVTVNPELGCFYFESDNESMATEGEYLKLNFSASNDISIAGFSIAHLNIYSNTTRITEPEINIRLFAISGSRLTFAPIAWSELAETYYTNWFLSYFRIRVINAEFNLSKLDVMRWHEKQLCYIEYFKSTFIVLEISNFIPGRATKVKLLNYGR
jgi:hypothetical protein